MTLIIGPLFSGQEEYVAERFGPDVLASDRTLNHAETKAYDATSKEELTQLSETLCSSYEIILFTETGGGVVPMDAGERFRREQAGRLACLLAEQADTVIRMCCGLPMVLKGTN